MSPSFQCVVVLGVKIKGALVLNGLIFLRIMLKTVQTFFENLARNFEHVSYLFPVFFFEHANANNLTYRSAGCGGSFNQLFRILSQPAFTRSMLTMETVEQRMKYVQS